MLARAVSRWLDASLAGPKSDRHTVSHGQQCVLVAWLLQAAYSQGWLCVGV